ncbi:MAG: hypothetical protein ACLRFH_01990, partial [Opitutales bacterium]
YHAKKLEKNFSSVGWESREKVGQALSTLSNNTSLSARQKTDILKTLDKKFAKELLAKSDQNTNEKLETIANRLSNEIKMLTLDQTRFKTITPQDQSIEELNPQQDVQTSIEDSSSDNMQTQQTNQNQPQVSKQKIETSNHESNEIPEQITTNSAEDKTKGIDNQTKEKILGTTNKVLYKLANSKNKQKMILDQLPESMDNATLDSILNDERCSRGVKTALLLSPDLTYEQKLKVVNSDKNNEIVAYCQKHKNVFPQVRSALTPTSKVKQGSTQFISKNSPTNLKSFVNAFFDQNGQFTTPDDIKAARNFFNPTTFTTEERTTIVELLKEKKKQIGNASTSPKTMEELNNVNQEKQINRLKIDMMIAQFTEPWDEGLTQKFKIFDGLTKDVINILESNIDEAMNIDDSTGTITMQNFLKNPEEIAQKLSYIEDTTLVFNQFQSPKESFPNSAILNCNVMIAQQYPRLGLLIKDACKPNNSLGHIDRVLNEAKSVLIDFEHGQKIVFIAKKCSEFIEQHKNDKEYKGKTSDAIEKNFLLKNGFSNSTGIGDLTKTNAKEVTQLAQALGYKETQ